MIGKIITFVAKTGVGLGVLYLLVIIGVAVDKHTSITFTDVATLIFILLGSYAIGTIIFAVLDRLYEWFFKSKTEESVFDSSSTYTPVIKLSQPITDEEIKEWQRFWDYTFGDEEDLEDDESYYDDFGNPT